MAVELHSDESILEQAQAIKAQAVQSYGRNFEYKSILNAVYSISNLVENLRKSRYLTHKNLQSQKILDSVLNEIESLKKDYLVDESREASPLFDSAISISNSIIEIVHIFYQSEEKAKGITADGPKRTRRTPGEPTKPKNVYFPQSMLEDLKAVAGQRGDSVNKLIVDMCGEGLRQGSGPAPIMIALPASASPDLRERVDEMATSFSKVIAQMVADAESLTSDPDDGLDL